MRLSQSYSDDFHAFYCGGAAVAGGADPYRVEPLRTCEHHNGDIHALPLEEGAVLPVPLPGYDLAASALFARLPYGNAALLWQLFLWSSVAVTIICMRRLTGIPLAVLIAVFLFSDGYISSLIGQIAPTALAGISFAAWSISRRRYALSVLGVTVSLCEPHIGLAPFIAVFICVPSVRWILSACAGLLGFLTYETIGFKQAVEYVHDVLPAHASSEIAHRGQYSLTSFLHFMGVSDSAALFLGALSYAGFVVIGVIVAYRLRRSLDEEAFLIVIPAAFALLGGVFIHITQMAIALPAGLLLYSKYPRGLPALRWGIMLLAVPWSASSDLAYVQLFVALCIAVFSWYFLENAALAAQAAIVQVAAFTGGSFLFHAEHVNDAATAAHAQFVWKHLAAPSNALSDNAWSSYVSEVFSRHATLFFFFKIPTLLGSAMIAGQAFFCAGSSKDRL